MDSETTCKTFVFWFGRMGSRTLFELLESFKLFCFVVCLLDEKKKVVPVIKKCQTKRVRWEIAVLKHLIIIQTETACCWDDSPIKYFVNFVMVYRLFSLNRHTWNTWWSRWRYCKMYQKTTKLKFVQLTSNLRTVGHVWKQKQYCPLKQTL